ncbi:MAG: 2-oxo acid dehydrogenase subunit E2, partial [Flavobacterium sp.]|nr:2-oxo acid dehydrogenase subunit E2 [Flavobacterium sp.]
MATVITMPRLSDTMTEGVVASWLKKVGDTIKTGEILAEIETDKATMEFESFYDGVLLHIGIQEGESAPVDSLLAIVGKQGEDISALLTAGAPEKQTTPLEDVKTETKTATTPSEIPVGVKVVTMPRLSDTMTTGTVATWLKKVGDTVKEGDILAEIETDKATMEFESFNAGTLLYIGVEEGGTAPVDTILAILGPAGTDVSGIAADFAVGATVATPKIEDVNQDTNQIPSSQQPILSSNDRIFASPLAKKIASDKGVNLSQVKGSGENGRITKSDVENFTPSIASSPVHAIEDATNVVSAVKPFVPAGEMFQEEIKNSQMRKTIARRLAESKFTAPHYYLTIELDIDNAIASRNTINSLPETKVSFTDMVIKASAMALKNPPQVNSQW